MDIRSRPGDPKRLVTFVVLSIVLFSPPKYTEAAECAFCLEALPAPNLPASTHTDCIAGGPPTAIQGPPGDPPVPVKQDCEQGGCTTGIVYDPASMTILMASKVCEDGSAWGTVYQCVKSACGHKGDCVTITEEDVKVPNVLKCFESTPLQPAPGVTAKICVCDTDKCNEVTPDTTIDPGYNCTHPPTTTAPPQPPGPTSSAVLEASSKQILGIGMAAIIVLTGR